MRCPARAMSANKSWKHTTDTHTRTLLCHYSVLKLDIHFTAQNKFIANDWDDLTGENLQTALTQGQQINIQTM